MNKFLYLNKKINLGLLLLLMTIIIGVGWGVNKAQALNTDPIIFTPQVTIPGSSFQKNSQLSLASDTGPIAEYISAIYNYGVGIVGIVAALMLMLGGIIWLTAAGSSSKIEEAKSIIGSSLTGMALVITAVILLQTVNPDLVSFKPIQIDVVRERVELTCCGGVEGIKIFEIEINDKGERVSPYDHKTIVSCPSNMQTIDEKTQVCAGKENVYSVISKGPACGDSGGFCLPFRPDGWADDFWEDCPDGTSCEYHDSNVKQKGQKCGSKFSSTCQYPGNNLHCPDGYEWDEGSGSDCGAELYCCYSYQGQEAAVIKANCSDPGTITGSSCKTSNNENGFCENKTCIRCFTYGEACTDDYKCKDQAGNGQENPSGPCGNQIDGDCSFWTCDSDDH
ncbi:MAG: pilin [Patescibacteria group bacterium]